ncbi:MAG: hypothetical protein GF384_03880 [Elusimicrobia bacterium]|nr:hypothetical protein [Elusimicrobiota bacterium]
MRGFILIVLIIISIGIGFSHYFNSGKFQQYLDNHPEISWVPRAQYYVGQYYFLRNDHTRSIDAVDRILTVHPKSVYAQKGLYLKCKNFEYLKQWNDAYECYQLYLKTYPDDPQKEEVIRRKITRLQDFVY